jgi:hypothetical protein
MESDRQTGLVAAGNTYNPSLIILRSEGYDLALEEGEDRLLWIARKGNCQFLAYSGPELLGLVVLWEHLGENWNRQTPDIIGELCSRMEA